MATPHKVRSHTQLQAFQVNGNQSSLLMSRHLFFLFECAHKFRRAWRAAIFRHGFTCTHHTYRMSSASSHIKYLRFRCVMLFFAQFQRFLRLHQAVLAALKPCHVEPPASTLPLPSPPPPTESMCNPSDWIENVEFFCFFPSLGSSFFSHMYTALFFGCFRSFSVRRGGNAWFCFPLSTFASHTLRVTEFKNGI